MSLIYPAGDQQVTPKLLLATWGMDEELANNMILIDNAFAGIAGPGGSNGDIQYNNAGAFGGSATTINAAGTITVPNGQQLKDPAGDALTLVSGVAELADSSNDALVMSSGQAGLADSVSDQILVGGGTNNWQIDNAAGSASISQPTSSTTIAL